MSKLKGDPMGEPRYVSVQENDTEDSSDDIELQPIRSGRCTSRSASESRRSRRNPSVLYLVVFYLINSLAFGLAAVPHMNLVVSLVCRQILKDRENDPSFSGPNTSQSPVVPGTFNAQCMVGDISSQTAKFISSGNLIVGFLAALSSTVLAKWSDRIGRVRVIAANMVGLIASETILVTVAKYPDFFHYRWLYLAYAVDGITGTYALIMVLAGAYISDCTEEDKRNLWMGRIHGAMFIGIAVGPLLSNALGIVGADRHPLLVFYICLAMRFGSVLYLKLVPESLPTYNGSVPPTPMTPRTPTAWLRPQRAVGLVSRLKYASPRRWLNRLVPSSVHDCHRLRKNIVLLIAMNLVAYGSVMGIADVLILYPQMVFKWGNKENNNFVSAINTFRTIVSVAALPVMIKMFQSKAPLDKVPTGNGYRAGADGIDKALLRSSFLMTILGFLGYAFAWNGVVFTLSSSLAAFGAIILSTTVATLTKHVDTTQAGELMGGLSLLQALIRIVAPSTVSIAYSWTVQFVPQTAFIGVAVFLSMGLLLTPFMRIDT